MVAAIGRNFVQAESFKRHSKLRPYVIDNDSYSSMVGNLNISNMYTEQLNKTLKVSLEQHSKEMTYWHKKLIEAYDLKKKEKVCYIRDCRLMFSF